MPCFTPYRGDSSQLLLFKIASCLEAGGGGGAVTAAQIIAALGCTPACEGDVVNSFNTRVGDVILSLADVAAVADSRYVLKAGDTMTGALAMPAGSAALPSNTFSGDLNTGLYSPGADSLGFSTGGTLRLTMASTAVTSTVPILLPDGTAAFPSLTFSADTDTGLYRIGANNLGVSTLGLLRVSVISTGFVGIDVAVPDFKLDVRGSGNDGVSAALQVRNTAALGNTLASAFFNLKVSDASGFMAVFPSDYTIVTFRDRLVFGANSDASGVLINAPTIGNDIRFIVGSSAETARINLTDFSLFTGVRLSISSGANQRAGDAVLVAGTVTVANTTVTANTRVFVSRKTAGGALGTSFTYTVIAATSFTITSSSITDTSTVSYLLIEVP